MTIKRISVTPTFHGGVNVSEDPNGPWCRVEDVQVVLEAAERERDALAAHVEELQARFSPSSWPEEEQPTGSVIPVDPAEYFGTPETSLARRDVHPDDAAVDRFAVAMKEKLARAREKGRSGWDDHGLCSAEHLGNLLVGHLQKDNNGNLVDISNLAMMLHQRGDDPQVVADALTRLIAEKQAEVLYEFTHGSYIMPVDLNLAMSKRAKELRRQADEE